MADLYGSRPLPSSRNTPVQHVAEEESKFTLVFLRWVGTIVDMLLFVALLVGPYILLGPDLAGQILVAPLVLIAVYYPLLEGLTGRTLGKFVTGLHVVDKNGDKPGLGRAFLRTLARLLEVNPFLLGGIIAGICVLVTARGQRLGDMMAQTYVIRGSALKERVPALASRAEALAAASHF